MPTNRFHSSAILIRTVRALIGVGVAEPPPGHANLSSTVWTRRRSAARRLDRKDIGHELAGYTRGGWASVAVPMRVRLHQRGPRSCEQGSGRRGTVNWHGCGHPPWRQRVRCQARPPAIDHGTVRLQRSPAGSALGRRPRAPP